MVAVSLYRTEPILFPSPSIALCVSLLLEQAPGDSNTYRKELEIRPHLQPAYHRDGQHATAKAALSAQVIRS
jgi:hypothetical protein